MTFTLFERYPHLAESLPRTELCDLPTPVARLEKSGSTLNTPNLYIKRDDISAPTFGGNKVRALEFLLGAALRDHAKRAVVMGLAGTSMALASTLYAKRHHLNLATVLFPQHATEEARHNLLLFCRLGAELHTASRVYTLVPRLMGLMLGGLLRNGTLPKMFNPSSPLGMTGYVNAAFELKRQVEQGTLPEPDRLYIPMGLLGTASGLTLGLRAAGLKTQLIAVHHPHDQDGIAKTKTQMVKLLQKANAFLRSHDSTFPLVEVQPNDIEIRCDMPGQQSSTLLSEGVSLIESVRQNEGVALDATWTAPAWVAMRRDSEANQLHDKVVLFWHTYNSRPDPVDISGMDYHQLPKVFHRYFEEEVHLVNKPLWAGD